MGRTIVLAAEKSSSTTEQSVRKILKEEDVGYVSMGAR